MNSEVFVINVVKASGRASALVADLLGPWVGPNRHEVMHRLPQEESTDRLAELLQCPKDEVFDRLATRIARSLIEGRPSPAFTFRHLHQLTHEEPRRRLARTLTSEPSYVFDDLFDVYALLRILFEVEPSAALLLVRSAAQHGVSLPPAEWVLIRLLKLQSQVEAHYQMNEYQWGAFLDEQRLLRDSALSRLRRYAIEHGFADDSGANLLAAAMETRTYAKPDDERNLDALAILHVRLRIDWIVRQMRDQAQELALAVGDAAPSHSPLARLRPHIEFYELKAPARAWRIVLDLKGATVPEREPTLREKLSTVEVHSTGAAGTPKEMSFLRVRTEDVSSQPPWWQFWRKPQVLALRLIVSCEVEEHDLPVDILVCPSVSPVQVTSLEKLFASLPSLVIASQRVQDMGVQLLDSRHKPIDTFHQSLVNSCAECLPELIRSLILAGVDLPGGVESPWDELLSYQLPVEPTDREQDTLFPLGRSDILSRIQQEYAHQNYLLVIE